MDLDQARQLAERLLKGSLNPDDFARQLSQPATADLHEAQIDLDRARRCGFPEVVFGQGKTVATLEKIFKTLLDRRIDVLATRITTEQAEALQPVFEQGRYNPTARTLTILANARETQTTDQGQVVVVTAGTSDLPVAEEARETLAWMGVQVTMIFDVGVAGPHRLRERLSDFAGADAVVVVAGMEGALPSVVGGYIPCPVIGVPTSVGYGASLGGIAALLSMLNSCAANVTVVNIDAGFKGGYVAGLIAKRAADSRRGANA
jgi:pyridinium-3,5-biscarboxylic acid mononucleotide synthase